MKFERWPDGTYRNGPAVIEEVLRRHDYGYEGARWTLRIDGRYVGGFRTLARAKTAAQIQLATQEKTT